MTNRNRRPTGRVEDSPHSSDHGEAQSNPQKAIEQRLNIGGWQVTLRWSTAAGPDEITIRAAADADLGQIGGGITPTLLRAIPLTRAKRVRRQLDGAQSPRNMSVETSYPPERLAQYIRESVKADPRPGRRGRTDEFYAAVAAIYCLHVALESSRPVHQVADTCGFTWRMAANWVRLARCHGMLTEGVEREVGGKLTTRAIAILDGLLAET
jgi:hypothetical protein